MEGRKKTRIKLKRRIKPTDFSNCPELKLKNTLTNDLKSMTILRFKRVERTHISPNSVPNEKYRFDFF